MKSKAIYIIFASFLVLDVFIWHSIVLAHSSRTDIYFLNVGQGDSQLVFLPNDSYGRIKFIIDGGPDASLARELGKVLPGTDRYIDLLIITHPEADHADGFISILKNYEVGAIIINGRSKDTATWRELVKSISVKNIPVIVLGEGDKLTYGKNALSFLSPGQEFIQSDALNDTGFVSLLESKNIRALFTADIGANVESVLVKKYDLHADILKVGHHGSKYSSSDEFLASVRPKFAIIQVGAKNRYGHPTSEALARLKSAGAAVYRNDLDGTIRVSIGDGGEVNVFKDVTAPRL